MNKLSKSSEELVSLFSTMKPEEIIGLAKFLGVKIGKLDCTDKDGNAVQLDEVMRAPKNYNVDADFKDGEEVLVDIIVAFEMKSRRERREIIKGLKRRKK